MEQSLQIIHNRNILIIRVLWFFVVLGIAMVVLQGRTDAMLYASLGGIAAYFCLLTFFIIRKRLINLTMYGMTIGLSLFAFIIVIASPNASAFMMIFISFAFTTLYNKRPPIIISGALGMLMSLYFHMAYKDVIFPGLANQSIATMNFFMVCVVVALYFQTLLGNRLQAESMRKEAEAIEAERKLQLAFADVRLSIEALSRFEEQLREHVAVTGNISEQLTASFIEQAQGIEQQAGSVGAISTSIQSIHNEINAVTMGAEALNQISQTARQFTEQGAYGVNRLSEGMHKVSRTHSATARIIAELQEQMTLISEITATITGLANQTRLLALNAAIEAARAGEMGKGFSVVSGEVRKLSDQSLIAADKISGILDALSEKVEQTSKEVSVSTQAIHDSEAAVGTVEQLFDKLRETSEQAAWHALEINQEMQRLGQVSSSVLQEVSNVSAVTQQSAASMEEVTASIEEQDRRIDNIVASFAQLNTLSSRLKQLAGMDR